MKINGRDYKKKNKRIYEKFCRDADRIEKKYLNNCKTIVKRNSQELNKVNVDFQRELEELKKSVIYLKRK